MRSDERPLTSPDAPADDLSGLGIDAGNKKASTKKTNGALDGPPLPLRTAPFSRLPWLGEMMKRTSSQSYKGSPSLLAGAPTGLDTITSRVSAADGISKKARFVSEGNIPPFAYTLPGANGLGLNSNINTSGQPGPDGSPSLSAASIYGSLIGGMPGSSDPQQPGNRSFSGTSSNMMGQSPFIQHQPGQQNQYAPPPLTIPGSNSMLNNNGNGSGFSPINSSQSIPYMMGLAGDGQMGTPMSGMSSMYPGFSPGGFSSTPGGGGMPGFMPNVAIFQQPPQNNPTGRTVYVGSLPADASVDELLNQVKFGPIESVRVLAEKNCAFISFLDGATAAAFHADATVKKMSLLGHELKIGWGKPSAMPNNVAQAVQECSATRNVYLGQLDEDTTEQTLRDELSRFGPIDQVKIVRDKNIGFVHFLSIAVAMKVVDALPQEPSWAGKRVNYGKDRCAYVPRSQQQNQAHNNQAAAMGMAAAASLGYPAFVQSGGFAMPGFGMGPASAPANLSFQSLGGSGSPNPSGGSGGAGDDSRGPPATAGVFGPGNSANLGMGNPTALHQIGNRTVYLGNIHPDTTTEEICNHIRGGILQSVRYLPEKHIAFVTFVDANTALAFYHLASFTGVMIHQRRLKIGWGKNPGPLSPAIAMAVQAGGSRNVYIGNIENWELLTDEKLRQDFGEYGEIELVNSLREKNCAFVNFCNIQQAIKAIEAMKNHPDYQGVRIAYGKDRCGNPPRSVSQSLNAVRKSSGSLSPNQGGGLKSSSTAADDAAVTSAAITAAAAAASAAAAAAQAAGGVQAPEISAAIGLSAIASGAVASADSSPR